jgi:hypothetical protein
LQPGGRYLLVRMGSHRYHSPMTFRRPNVAPRMLNLDITQKHLRP